MERMQSQYENQVDYNLSESGVDPMSVRELVGGSRSAGRLLETALGYVQTNGSEGLRDRVARFYPGARRANILMTNGGSEANYATFWALLEKGDRVAFMVPNYMQAMGLAQTYAGRVDPFRLVLRRGNGRARWALDRDGLERAVTPKTRIVLVTNPNNPTGGILDEEEMDAIVRAARRAGAWLVADEIYRGAEVDGRTTPTFWGRYEKVLITSGLSKAFGLPGLRIGWVVGPPKVVQRLWSYRDYTTIAIGAVSDHLATIALDPARREAIFARTRAIIRRNLPRVQAWLDGHDGLFEYVPPLAGAIVLARYNLKVPSGRLADSLRTRQSVLIIPGDQLGIERHIRIGLGSDGAYTLRGLRRIDQGIAAFGGGPRRPARGRGAGVSVAASR
jgi:hypothetical protein